jgi:hypothetical protein
MTVRINCINKSGGYHENPHEAISVFGWVEDGTNKTGRTDRETMWKWVTDGGQAYVKDAYGNTAKVIAKTNSRGTHYLQTVADRTPTDNLLKLPECP